MSYEAIVVGGGYAGLAAALQLARARRRVLVVDGGRRRNRFAAVSHGFLTRDGETPEAIARIGRTQLLAYGTVDWRDDRVESAVADDGGFAVVTRSGARLRGERLVLAPGVVDELPPVPGLEARWGGTVFACPYCHGYELGGGRIGVLATSEAALHQALMLPDWGPTTLLANGAFEPDAEQAAQLERRGVTLERARVATLEGAADVVLEDGRRLAFAGLFVATRTRVATPLAERLGCAFEAGPQGDFIRADDRRATSVEGVFACGDAARPFGSVTLAVADGAMAGFGVHQSLLAGRLRVDAG